MKKSIREYLNYSKGQQRAILVLLFLILSITITYFLLPRFIHLPPAIKNDELQKLMAQIEWDTEHDSKSFYKKNEPYKPLVLSPFNFDPNLLDEAGFKRLGLRDKLVKTLLNYRNKGGKFYNKESLKRIYGLHEDEYKQLEAFISIPNQYSKFDKGPKEVLHIELNSADTTQLIKLRGIGSKLSMNIIRFRTQLGGFSNLAQLKEVYGISEETFETIKGSLHVNKNLIKTLNLNAATLYELNTHPYLKGDLARALVDYRKNHNYKIENLDQIKEIPLINDEIFRKIVPYLSIQ